MEQPCCVCLSNHHKKICTTAVSDTQTTSQGHSISLSLCVCMCVCGGSGGVGVGGRWEGAAVAVIWYGEATVFEQKVMFWKKSQHVWSAVARSELCSHYTTISVPASAVRIKLNNKKNKQTKKKHALCIMLTTCLSVSRMYEKPL